MNRWVLPGPDAFLSRVERSVRDGANIVIAFPEQVPLDFESELRARCDGAIHFSALHVGSDSRPVDFLFDRYAPRVPAGPARSSTHLCEQEAFQGQLLWLDGLVPDNWHNWNEFLSEYAHSCRAFSPLTRTVLALPIAGSCLAGLPNPDVTVAVHCWQDVVDETDMFVLASNRLRQCGVAAKRRALLSATVSRVAIWDLELAERLLAQPPEVILSPWELLREFGKEKGWTRETPARWELGTADGSGARHSALAIFDISPRELQRRLWSAQASTLFPLIEELRHKIISENLRRIPCPVQTREGVVADPFDIEVNLLCYLLDNNRSTRSLREQVRRLRAARNALAHLEPLQSHVALSLVE